MEGMAGGALTGNKPQDGSNQWPAILQDSARYAWPCIIRYHRLPLAKCLGTCDFFRSFSSFSIFSLASAFLSMPFCLPLAASLHRSLEISAVFHGLSSFRHLQSPCFLSLFPFFFVFCVSRSLSAHRFSHSHSIFLLLLFFEQSPRTELLYGLSPICSGAQAGTPTAALRQGPWKLLAYCYEIKGVAGGNVTRPLNGSGMFANGTVLFNLEVR